MNKLINIIHRICYYSFWPVLIIVIILSVAPNKAVEMINSDKSPIRIDYILHFLTYSGLVLINYIGTPFDRSNKHLFDPGIFLIFFLAVCTEAFQILIPWRTFNWWDMAMNTGGVSLGILMSIFFAGALRKLRNPNK